MLRKPDVEVLFCFNGVRKTAVAQGYRPDHLVKDKYLTTGIHHYFGVDSVPPDGTAKGTITFLSPESYPHCLWIGKKISIQEGARIVGYATITSIYNPLLCLENQEQHRGRFCVAQGTVLCVDTEPSFCYNDLGDKLCQDKLALKAKAEFTI